MAHIFGSEKPQSQRELVGRYAETNKASDLPNRGICKSSARYGTYVWYENQFVFGSDVVVLVALIQASCLPKEVFPKSSA